MNHSCPMHENQDWAACSDCESEREDAAECVAVLASNVAKQEAAASIVAALNNYLMGRRIAAAVQAEREERARVDAHYGRLVASTKCEDCESMCGEGPCREHDKNRDYL